MLQTKEKKEKELLAQHSKLVRLPTHRSTPSWDGALGPWSLSLCQCFANGTGLSGCLCCLSAPDPTAVQRSEGHSSWAGVVRSELKVWKAPPTSHMSAYFWIFLFSGKLWERGLS